MTMLHLAASSTGEVRWRAVTLVRWDWRYADVVGGARSLRAAGFGGRGSSCSKRLSRPATPKPALPQLPDPVFNDIRRHSSGLRPNRTREIADLGVGAQPIGPPFARVTYNQKGTPGPRPESRDAQLLCRGMSPGDCAPVRNCLILTSDPLGPALRRGHLQSVRQPGPCPRQPGACEKLPDLSIGPRPDLARSSPEAPASSKYPRPSARKPGRQSSSGRDAPATRVPGENRRS
jgi:hypothetical protein